MKISLPPLKLAIVMTLALSIAASSFAGELVISQTKPASQPKKSSRIKKVVKERKPAPDLNFPDEDDVAPEVADTIVLDYKCELGNFFTTYTNTRDDAHIALRWKKGLYRLKKVATTTGAVRFENKKYGFVWIGIPAKSMLLDSLKGQQLANECKASSTQL